MHEPVDQYVTPEAESKPKIGGGCVTDPNKHQEGNFRYTVYGINLSAKFAMMDEGLKMAESGLATQDEITKQATNLLVRPEMVASRVGVSMSIIDQDHRGTWGDVGLIIGVPVENMIATSTSDLGSGGTSAEWLRRIGQRHQILDPEQILGGSGKDNYNEIVAWGTTESGSKLKLVGFFAKTVEGEYVDAENAYQLEAQAKRLGIPLVKIEQPNRFSEEGMEVSSQYQKLYVDYRGRRYILSFGDSDEFDVMNSKLESRFMSPQELDHALSYIQPLMESGNFADLPENIISILREKYNQADKARRAPVFGRYGNLLSGFTMTMGYGDGEYEVRVGKHGAYRFSMPFERAESRRILALGDRFIRSKNSAGIVLSAKQVDQLLEENLKLLPPEAAKQIQDYYDNARVAIQQTFEREQKNRVPNKLFPELDISKLSEFLKRRKSEEDKDNP